MNAATLFFHKPITMTRALKLNSVRINLQS